MFSKILTVWVFGGIGAVVRYGIATFMQYKGWSAGNLLALPTLVINVLACFIIGLAAGYLCNSTWTQEWKTWFSLAATTGFCGGFSTFSTYTLDCLRYSEQGRLGVWIFLAALTLLLGLAATSFGYYLGRKI